MTAVPVPSSLILKDRNSRKTRTESRELVQRFSQIKFLNQNITIDKKFKN